MPSTLSQAGQRSVQILRKNTRNGESKHLLNGPWWPLAERNLSELGQVEFRFGHLNKFFSLHSLWPFWNHKSSSLSRLQASITLYGKRQLLFFWKLFGLHALVHSSLSHTQTGRHWLLAASLTYWEFSRSLAVGANRPRSLIHQESSRWTLPAIVDSLDIPTPQRENNPRKLISLFLFMFLSLSVFYV